MTDFSKRNAEAPSNAIPIMFKTYPGGKFTEGMVKGPIKKVVIS